MDFKNYQNQSKRTAVYPNQSTLQGLEYTTLGLTEEAGEIAGNVKRIFRDDNETLTSERVNKIIDEMGDLLWYLAQLCYELNTSLETVATRNLAKLRKRQRGNTLHGSGDDR